MQQVDNTYRFEKAFAQELTAYALYALYWNLAASITQLSALYGTLGRAIKVVEVCAPELLSSVHHAYRLTLFEYCLQADLMGPSSQVELPVVIP